MDLLKPNVKRAKYAIACLWIMTIYSILDILTSAVMFSDNDSTMSYLNILLSTVISFFTSLCFIQWFRRAYYNLHILTSELSYSEGWAAGSWFVPLVNIYMPYKIMKEMFITAHKILAFHDQTLDFKVPFSLIRTWWGLWVSGTLVTLTFAFYIFYRPYESNTILVSGATILVNLASIVSLLLIIKIVQIYREYEISLINIPHLLNPENDLSRHLRSENEF